VISPLRYISNSEPNKPRENVTTTGKVLSHKSYMQCKYEWRKHNETGTEARYKGCNI